jgi:hypothetical protein
MVLMKRSLGLSAGESKRFSSPLVGMAEGETGDIDVTVKAGEESGSSSA